MIVPADSTHQVVGDANVMTRGILIASEDVDEPLFDSVHAHTDRRLHARGKRPPFRDDLPVVCSFCKTARKAARRISQSERRSDFARYAGSVETAFA